jgi:outer membrane protein TolC
MILCATAPGVALGAGPGADEPLLGRFPAVEENGRKLARINLKDLLALVLERNLSVQASQVGQSAARQSLRAAQERLQPNLSTSVGYTRSISPGVSSLAPSAGAVAPAFISLLGQNSTTLQANLSQQDWLGNTYSLAYQETRLQSQNMLVQNEGEAPTLGSSTDPKDYSSLTGTITIPLAQNSGRAFNRVPVGQAEVGVRVSRLATRKQELNTLNSVSQSYWNLVGQLEIVAVSEEAVRLSERLLRDNRVRLQAGTLSPADVLASDAQLARDRQSLLQARLLALNLEDQLRQAIGLDQFDFGFKPSDPPTLRPPDYDPVQELERVYRNNPDLASLQANLETNGYDLLSAENAAKPQVNLALSYIFNGYSKDPLAGSAYYGQTQTQGYAATLNYVVPLFDKVGPANIQRRILERQSLDLQIRDQRAQLNIQLQSALRNIRQAEEQVSTARTAMQLARVQLQNEIDKLAQGRSTAYLVAQLQQQLAQAQQQEIAARIQFEQNDMTRLALTGELFSRFGLESDAMDSP